MPPPPRAILFDWDNTLVDSWVCIQESYNRTFRHFAMPEWDMAETRANVAKSLRDSFPAMFGARWEEAREVFYQSFEAIHLSHLRPLPGAAEMLAALAAIGIPLGVVSNKVGAYLRREAEALGWAGHFGRLVGATDAEADKPDAAPVLLALAACDLRPGPEIWFVGDAAIDIRCGVNAGCTPLLLRAEPPHSDEFADCPPFRYLAGCAELTGLVRELAVPISQN
jgi:phosphoglycolate phosphatase